MHQHYSIQKRISHRILLGHVGNSHLATKELPKIRNRVGNICLGKAWHALIEKRFPCLVILARDNHIMIIT